MIGSEKFRPWLQRPVLEKKDAPAPDYAPLANASKESAEIMEGLGREQLNFSRQQYNEAKPLFDKLVAQQMGIADETAGQARDDRQYNIDTYRPLERGLVADANNYDTAAKREQLASVAAADAGRAFANTQAASNRAMASMGVNPNSGKFAGMQTQNALGLAAMRTGAMNNTRMQAEQIGYARKMDAAGLGRNLTGASQGAYQLAIGAGNSAGQNQQSPGNTAMHGMAQGNATIGSGRTMLQSGLGNVLSTQANVYNADSQGGLDVGGLMQGAAAMKTAGMFSDRRLKENIEAIGIDEGTGLPIYEFNYLSDPGTRYRGVMADDVSEVYPDAVTVDEQGFMMVDYAQLGIQMEVV